MESSEIECSLCSAKCANTINADKLGWDWFCGYLTERFVVCPKCREDKTMQPLIERKKESSKIYRPPVPIRRGKSRIILL